MDSIFKPLATRPKLHIDDLLEYLAFKEKWEACTNKLVEERASEKAAALVQEGGDAVSADAEPDPLKSSNPTHFKENSAADWTAYASQFVKQYVRLVPEPDSVRVVGRLGVQLRAQEHPLHRRPEHCDCLLRRGLRI